MARLPLFTVMACCAVLAAGHPALLAAEQAPTVLDVPDAGVIDASVEG